MRKRINGKRAGRWLALILTGGMVLAPAASAQEIPEWEEPAAEAQSSTEEELHYWAEAELWAETEQEPADEDLFGEELFAWERSAGQPSDEDLMEEAPPEGWELPEGLFEPDAQESFLPEDSFQEDRETVLSETTLEEETEEFLPEEEIGEEIFDVSLAAPQTPEEAFAGSGSEESPFIISSVADLQQLAALIAAGESCEGSVFVLTEDLALPSDWEGLGALKSGAAASSKGRNILPFSGILDGGGHTVTAAEGGQPLFAYVREAAVRNLNIAGAYINGNGLVAKYVVDYGADGNYDEGTGGSYAEGCPDTIDITNVTILAGTSIRGSGLIGGNASGGNVVNIRNCKAETGVRVGVEPDGSSTLSDGIGSFAGAFNGTISDSVSYASVYGKNQAGGLAGRRGQSMGPFAVSDSSFHGQVHATGNYAGGIVGSGYSEPSAPNTCGVDIVNCTVTGTVSGTDRVGGIFGGEPVLAQLWSPDAIRGNVFTGTLLPGSGAAFAGGIIGYLESLNVYYQIENNEYGMDCGAEQGIGGIRHIDTGARAFGADDQTGVLYYNSSRDSLSAIQALVDGAGSEYQSVARTGLNREDDPLGADAQNLTRSGEPETPVVTELVLLGSCRQEYTVGETLDLSGLQVQALRSDGSLQEVPLDQIQCSGFDSGTAGEQTLILSYESVSAMIQVTVRYPEGTIGVTFCLLGDTLHDSVRDGSWHTLWGTEQNASGSGALIPWVSEAACRVEANATAYDLILQEAKRCGFTMAVSGSQASTYIKAVTYNGTTLEEFDNGPNAGWMFTVNGEHPTVGVGALILKDGDRVVLHYTDDYIREDGSVPEQPETSAPGTGSGSGQSTPSAGTGSGSGQSTPSAGTGSGSGQSSSSTGTGSTSQKSETAGNPKDTTTVAGKAKQIAALKAGGEVAGSEFRKLRLQVSKAARNSLTLKWAKVTGAKGYIVYGAKRGTKLKQLTKLGSGKTTYTHKNLKKGTFYKYIVVAYRVKSGVQKVITTSRSVVAVTTGGSYTNYASLKAGKASVTLKRAKKSTRTAVLKVTVKAKSKKLKTKTWRGVRYESSNPKIADVSAKGKITAKKKGTCYVYVYAQNGIFQKVKVSVK